MSGWKRVRVPAALLAESPDMRAWQREASGGGHLSVFAGTEPPGFHLSISHRISNNNPTPGRYPTWDEIADARYRFAPLDVTMAMLLPPQGQYVNLHETTFHLWETPPAVPTPGQESACRCRLINGHYYEQTTCPVHAEVAPGQDEAVGDRG